MPSVCPMKRAVSYQTADPANTVSSAKRLIGRTLEDIDTSHLPYRFGQSDQLIDLQTRQGAKTPIDVSADILRALKARAEQSLGGELVGAVLVSPTDDLMLITSGGVLIRTKVEQVRETGRAAAGVRLINLDEGTTLVSLERVAESEEDEAEAAEGEA